MVEVKKVRLGRVAYEYKERIGEEAPDRPVYGVDKSVGLTSEPRYQSSNLSRYKRIEHGMFAYNPMRLNIGSIGFCHDNLAPGVVSPDYVVFGCHEGALLPKFMDYHTRSAPWSEWLSLAGEGSVRERIYFRKLETYELLLPDISYQEAAVQVLSALDDKIDLNRRMNETLEDLAQAIFKDWFVTFGPTRRKIEGATDPVAILGGLIPDPAKAAPLAALFPDSFDEDGLPEGWESYALETLASLSKASLSPNKTPDQEFEHYSLPAYDKGEEPVAEKGSAILSNKFVVPDNAVLLSKLNPEISRVWVPNLSASDPQVASTEFLVLVPKEGIGRSLLCAIFRDPSFRSGLEGMVTGTSKSHQRISPPALMNKEIMRGTIDIFSEFDALAAPLLERRLDLRTENRTLAETRDYLLPRLMSGAVGVRKAEEAVP